MKPKEIYDNSQSLNEEIDSDTDHLDYSTYKSHDILKTGYIGKYLGENIKYGENVYYLTNKGALKLYPSTDVLAISQGRNNCPVDITTITEDPMGETFRENNPYVFTGTNMSSYGSGITETGQSCGYAGSNVFVGEVTPLITTYRGCMSSQDPNALNMTNIGGNSTYTFEQCKELANINGYTSFSLNPSQTWGTLSTMVNENKTSIINSIDSIYPDGNKIFNELQTAIDSYSSEGQCYASKTPITSSEQTAFASPELYTLTTVNVNLNQFEIKDYYYSLALNNNANFSEGEFMYVMVCRGSSVGGTGIYIILGDQIVAQWLPQTNCNNGGGVNVIEATYGGNCSAKKNCSIQNGNFTENIRENVSVYGGVAYPSTASVTIGTLTSKDENGNITYYAAPSPLSPGCECDDLSYSMTYQCGNISKNITIPNIENPTQTTAAGSIINLDCSDVYNNCNFGIGISNDGETQILQGIGTNEITAVSLNAPYNGILVKNSSALTGTQVLSTTQVTYDNKLYSVFMAGNWSTEYLGIESATIGTNQMIVSPSGTCYITLGPNGFLTITYFVKSNSCSNKSGNWVGLIPSQGTYIADSGSTGESSEPLMVYAVNEILNESYIKNLGKKGYVDDDLILHEYPSTMMPTYTKTSGVNIPDSNSLTPTTTFTPTSIEQCKVTCDGMSGCNFFINDTANGIECSYYSSGTTVGSSGMPTGIDLYTKVQPLETNENCHFANSTIISTSDWEYYTRKEMMNTTSPCFITYDNYLNNQIETANQLKNKTQNNLQTQTDETNQYINEWGNLSTGFEKRIADIKNLTDTINHMNGIEGFTVETVNTMFHESQEIQKRNKYRNIFWSFLAITLLIMAARVIYLYLK